MFAADQRRFLAARGVLRMLLGHYLDRAPESIGFGYGPNGKPELERPGGNPPVCFNYSHSQGLALYAVTREGRIGVDLEALRPLPDAEQMARLCCSFREQLALAAVPADRRAEAFLGAWTIKEAYVKATGDGLAGRLDRIEVALTSGGVPEFHAADGDPDTAARWSVRLLSPAAGHVAACAVERHGYRLRCWSLDDSAAGWTLWGLRR